MIQHIVAWDYADGFSDVENKQHAQKMKDELEALAKIVDGIVELNVIIEPLPSSSRDIVLYSVFGSEEKLKAYQVHPEHERIAAFIGTVMTNRVCIDYTSK